VAETRTSSWVECWHNAYRRSWRWHVVDGRRRTPKKSTHNGETSCCKTPVPTLYMLPENEQIRKELINRSY